jgi:hypothetical protein
MVEVLGQVEAAVVGFGEHAIDFLLDMLAIIVDHFFSFGL